MAFRAIGLSPTRGQMRPRFSQACSDFQIFRALPGGVADKPKDAQDEIVRRVMAFSDFTPENDPHNEHDFGAFDFAGEKIFWKIDCYDLSMDWSSPNPADHAVTARVLTIMLANEY